MESLRNSQKPKWERYCGRYLKSKTPSKKREVERIHLNCCVPPAHAPAAAVLSSSSVVPVARDRIVCCNWFARPPSPTLTPYVIPKVASAVAHVHRQMQLTGWLFGVIVLMAAFGVILVSTYFIFYFFFKYQLLLLLFFFE